MKTFRKLTSAASHRPGKSTRATTTTRLFVAISMFAALALPACSGPSVSRPAFVAAPIVVDSVNDDDESANGCTLRAAVMAANLDMAIGGCPAGSGFDTIIVEATPILSRNESLTIQSDIEIQGATPYQPIIGRSSSFVVEQQASLIFRHIKLTEFTGTAVVVKSGGDFDAVSQAGFLEFAYSEISGNDGGIINETPSIENNGGTVGIFSTIIQNNVGGISGAAIRNLSGAVHVRDSSLIANVAGQSGGAIQNVSGGFVALSNVTISGNQLSGTDAGGGSAIWNGRGSTVEIDFSTVTANGATQSSAGIRNDGIMTISRSIVSGNGEDCQGRRIISAGFNLVGDCPNLLMTATDISGEPRLAPLTDGLQGGDLNSGQRYHVPLSDSAAVNAIPEGACSSPFLDQRYRSRPSQGACEIGSIETD